ncbi:MAG: cyclic nucleotide-binding domain-containing protein, partial [Arenicellales bacterium]|nr:cyclic nucleotide-binding domain-containing protein [Arenicellales bacterium]
MQASLAQTLSQSRLMTGLPIDVMESLARNFEDVHDVPAGEVFKQSGDDPQAAFLVHSGNVQVVEGRGLVEETYAYTVGRGEVVGMPALLDGAAANAEYRAAEDTTLAALPRAVFDEWLAAHSQYREPLSENAALDRQYHLLRKSQLFSELNAIDLYALVRELATFFEQHQAGDHLFHENDPAEAAFLVASGEYRLVKESAQDTAVATLSTGALTGLAGLLQHGKYNAALRAVSQAECWRLPRAQIEQLRSRSRKIDKRINRELALPRLENDALLFQPETEEGARLILELLRESPVSLWRRYRYNHQEPR